MMLAYEIGETNDKKNKETPGKMRWRRGRAAFFPAKLHEHSGSRPDSVMMFYSSTSLSWGAPSACAAVEQGTCKTDLHGPSVAQPAGSNNSTFDMVGFIKK